jgi:hypothetical protein
MLSAIQRFIHDNLNVIVAFILVFALGMGYTTWTLNTSLDNQKRQGQQELVLLCRTFDQLAADKPPVKKATEKVNPPSFVYLAELHQRFIELGREIGCRE